MKLPKRYAKNAVTSWFNHSWSIDIFHMDTIYGMEVREKTTSTKKSTLAFTTRRYFNKENRAEISFFVSVSFFTRMLELS